MKAIQLLTISLTSLVIASCTKLPNTARLSSEFYVATHYAPSSDFKQYNTFFIPDSIIVASDKPGDGNSLTGPDANKILDNLAKNMTARGYVQVADKDSADIGIPVTLIKNLQIYTDYYYPGYWWGYPGYPGGGYWGCPGCGYWYPGYSTYAYSTGTIVIELLDVKNMQNNQITVLWNAVIGSVYKGSTAVSETVKATDQAFTQSPYITNLP